MVAINEGGLNRLLEVIASRPGRHMSFPYFERLLEAYPAPRGTRRWLSEALLFRHVLGRVVDWLASTSPRSCLSERSGTLWVLGRWS
jgi:hypothetical protein